VDKKRKPIGPETPNQTTEVETASDSQNDGDDVVVKKWRRNVLSPRGIELVTAPLFELALDHYQYFGTDDDQCRQWILERAESEKNEGTVFLRGGDDFNTNIAEQYTEIAVRNLCEEEFATFAKTRLFTTPDFLPLKGKDIRWKAQRAIQLYTQPDASDDSLWVPPPLLSGEEYTGKDFSLKPDCAYRLSIRSFSVKHRNLVHMAIFTIDDRDTTAYLTIEFKKSQTSIEQATNQAVAASSLALFNRFRLKEGRLSASEKPWNRKHFDQIRHYMMTFTGPNAIIWLVRLKSSSASDQDYSKVAWNGCEAVKLWMCDCRTAEGVGDLVDHINAIHRWGLKHGEYCKRDVKATLSAKGGAIAKRVSDLYVSGEPIEDDEDEKTVRQEDIEDEGMA
jgi:hypothetical protein